eukprot:scpid55788/ scgid24782/ Casein kinase I
MASKWSERRDLKEDWETISATKGKEIVKEALTGHVGMFCGPGKAYVAETVIGHGHFGTVYQGRATYTREAVAMKVQDIYVRGCLSVEVSMLGQLAGTTGIPKLFWDGTNKNIHVMVTQLLGPSLRDLMTYYKTNAPWHPYFPAISVARLSVQMMERLGDVHKKGIVHRDVKPDNILMGQTYSQSDQLYLVDFGIGKKWVRKDTPFPNPGGKRSDPLRNAHGMAGTLRYASKFIQLGYFYSMRDDLVSYGYSAIYMSTGTLPWAGVNAMFARVRGDMVLEAKMKATPETLCKDMPNEYLAYMNYCYSLDYGDMPNHENMRTLFMQVCMAKKPKLDDMWQWELVLEAGKCDCVAKGKIDPDCKCCIPPAETAAAAAAASPVKSKSYTMAAAEPGKGIAPRREPGWHRKPRT